MAPWKIITLRSQGEKEYRASVFYYKRGCVKIQDISKNNVFHGFDGFKPADNQQLLKSV